MITLCNFSWWASLRQERVRCLMLRGHGHETRHANGYSWVAVGFENEPDIEGRWE